MPTFSKHCWACDLFVYLSEQDFGTDFSEHPSVSRRYKYNKERGIPVVSVFIESVDIIHNVNKTNSIR